MARRKAFGSKPSLAQLQASIMAQAPSGWKPADSKFPLAFMDKTPRKPRQEGQKNAHPEADLQLVCCQYLDLHKRILWWATPNSTWVGAMTPQKMGYLAKQKRLGVKKGIPDLSLLFRNKHGALTFCWAELKSDTGRPTEEQSAYMDRCNEIGGFTAVVRSVDDLKSLLETAGY